MSIIHSSEIWAKTDCLNKEQTINQAIFQKLTQLGFEKTHNERIWTRGQHRVIVCLVDDIRSCSVDYHTDLPYLYDRNTRVITDNYIGCPSVFFVVNLPESFFGIYNYQPSNQVWQPKRDFAFQVNRIDTRRFQLMLDLAWRTRLDLGYVNFNCEYRADQQLTVAEIFELFQPDINTDELKYLKPAYNKIASAMPYCNYQVDFDTVPYRAWINIVVETYASDNVVSLSEKIFRALITPAPWTVYSGRYTVAYLESLGFDCMSDIIDHGHYDRLKEVESKMRVFNWKSLEIVRHLKELGVDAVQARCLQASQHNQRRLTAMQSQFDANFTQWLDNLPNQLNFEPNQQ